MVYSGTSGTECSFVGIGFLRYSSLGDICKAKINCTDAAVVKHLALVFG